MHVKKDIKQFGILITLLLFIGVVVYFSAETYMKFGNKISIARDRCDKNILYSDSIAVLLTLGQSNSACYGQGKYICRNDVYEYFEGNVFKAEEPLLGADGNNGSSVWTRLADKLIDKGHYNKVILLPIGIGATTVECWSDGYCNKKLSETLEWIKNDSITVTHVIWHQGENDNVENTGKGVYKERLKKILAHIRQHGIKADFHICVASYHPYAASKHNGIDTLIQNAQIEFVKENETTQLCVNTDSINLAGDRYDGVHFSEKGLDKFAEKLYYSIVKTK